MFSGAPEYCCCEMDGREKITCGLVIAGCNGSELLELIEKILDQVTCLVPVFVINSFVRAMASRRYERSFASPSQWFKYLYVGVITFIGQDGFLHWHLEEVHRPHPDHRLGRRVDRTPSGCQRINGGVDLNAQPTFASSDCLVLV